MSLLPISPHSMSPSSSDIYEHGYLFYCLELRVFRSTCSRHLFLFQWTCWRICWVFFPVFVNALSDFFSVSKELTFLPEEFPFYHMTSFMSPFRLCYILPYPVVCATLGRIWLHQLYFLCSFCLPVVSYSHTRWWLSCWAPWQPPRCRTWFWPPSLPE